MKAKVKKVTSKVDCVSKIINFSSIERTSRFDKASFNGNVLLNSLPEVSPKMISLLENIEKLDKKDYNSTRKLYKHMIYSGVKGGYGSKMIASCMKAAGYTIVNKTGKITLDPEILHTKDEAKVALLSSTALWNTPTTPKITKEILSVFNKRPENTYGDLARFIILDSGFVEGIDLFDIKYIHMFEEQLYESQFIQATGRGLRFKGQCGLPYNKGWKVEIYNYVLYKTIPRDLYNFQFFNKKESIMDILKKEDQTLKYKQNLQTNLLDLIKTSAVDYTLNKKINETTGKDKYYIVKSIAVGLGALGASLAASFSLYKYLQRKKLKK